MLSTVQFLVEVPLNVAVSPDVGAVPPQFPPVDQLLSAPPPDQVLAATLSHLTGIGIRLSKELVEDSKISTAEGRVVDLRRHATLESHFFESRHDTMNRPITKAGVIVLWLEHFPLA